MRRLGLTVLVGTFALVPVLMAQDTVPHAPDGGTREQMESVYILPAPNAPFSAVVETEWTRIMPDGSKSTMYNHRTVARDSSGRVFQERRYFSPDGKTATTRLSMLQYDDPNRHERILCRPLAKVCEVSRLFVPPALRVQPAGPLPHGAGTLTREDLGRKSLEGVDVVGTREIMTLNVGTFGNEQPQPIIKEFWYSPRLQINVATKRFDPRASASQNIDVTQVNLSEPDPKLFQPPSGFRMIQDAQ